MFRILFVLIAAAVITFGSIILGNYLLRKVAQMNAELEAENVAEEALSIESYPYTTRSDYNSPDVFGASIVLSDYAGEDEAVLAVNTLAQHYDTVLLHITDENGMLTYTSPALCELNRMPSPENNIQFRLFASAAAAVKAQKMRLCVLLTPNFTSNDFERDALSDGTLISELALYGVDEVLIEFPADFSLTENLAESLYDYIVSCRAVSKNVCPIGILLSDSHYLADSEIMQVEKIADAASFLAIGFNLPEGTPMGTAYRRVNSNLTTLLGSFNVYNMRILLDGTNKILAATYEACTDAGMSNVCFMTHVLPEDLEYLVQSDEPELPDAPDPVDPSKNTNPYSEVKKPETEAPAETVPEIQMPDEPTETPWY